MEKPHPDAFISSERPDAGYREWMLCEPLPDGRMHTKVWREQIVPDNFFDVNRHVGQEQSSLVGNTQDHRRLVARIPDVVRNAWDEEDKELDPDEKDKAFKRRLNDSEWRKLRVGDKRV
jgi:hypothetical protein